MFTTHVMIPPTLQIFFLRAHFRHTAMKWHYFESALLQEAMLGTRESSQYVKHHVGILGKDIILGKDTSTLPTLVMIFY